MFKIVSPIIITDDTCGLSCYASPEEAVVTMESIDVANGIYGGYDSEGRLLKLETVDEKGHIAPSFYNVNDRFIRIVSTEEIPSYNKKLKDLIIKDLRGNYKISIEKHEKLSHLVSILFKLNSRNKKTNNIMLPVIVFENIDRIHVFDSLNKAEKFLSSRKLFESIYEIVDAFGTPLKFEIVENLIKNTFLKKVFLFYNINYVPRELGKLSVDQSKASLNVHLKELLKKKTETNGWQSNDAAVLINQFVQRKL